MTTRHRRSARTASPPPLPAPTPIAPAPPLAAQRCSAPLSRRQPRGRFRLRFCSAGVWSNGGQNVFDQLESARGQVEEIEGRGKQLHVTALRYDVAALERELRRLAEDRGVQARIDSDWSQVCTRPHMPEGLSQLPSSSPPLPSPSISGDRDPHSARLQGATRSRTSLSQTASPHHRRHHVGQPAPSQPTAPPPARARASHSHADDAPQTAIHAHAPRHTPAAAAACAGWGSPSEGGVGRALAVESRSPPRRPRRHSKLSERAMTERPLNPGLHRGGGTRRGQAAGVGSCTSGFS